MFESLGKQLRKPSGFYGRIVSQMMNRRNKISYKRMIEDLEIKSGEKVFEIGYGPGLGINMIAKAIPDCTICGIDFSELMYQQALKRNKKFVESGIVQLQFGDFLTQDLSIGKYDKVFCLNVIYFWADLHLAFSKVYSILNNGGVFSIFMTQKSELDTLSFTSTFNKYSVENVESELKNAGFQAVKYRLDEGYYIQAMK